MVSVSEATGISQSQASADLAIGVAALSLDQEITFTEYFRTVLPLDGYLFWVNAGSPPAVIKGALHYASDQRQEEDGTQAFNRVTFTTSTQVEDFNEIAPGSVLIADYAGLKIAFNAQAPFFQAAGLYHYSGIAVLPTMQTQVLDNAPDPSNAIVSNSLPMWLALNSWFPVYLTGMTPPYPAFTMPGGLTLYPSFAVPENLRPPYGVVHIDPVATESFGGFPMLGATLSSSQLAKERVRVTLYGCNNDVASTFLNFVLQYSSDAEQIGVLNIPAIRDGKKTQTELSTLAQQKFIDFDVSYLQSSARSVARGLIEKVAATYTTLPYDWHNA